MSTKPKRLAMRPRAAAAAVVSTTRGAEGEDEKEERLRQRIRALEAENEKLRGRGESFATTAVEKDRLAELEAENFDLQAQLSTCEAEKDYEIEKGLVRLAAELRFKNRELADRSAALSTTATPRFAAVSVNVECDDHVLDAVFSHSQESLPSRTREAVARLGRRRRRRDEEDDAVVVECLLAAIAEDCYELAYDLATAMLPAAEDHEWTELAYSAAAAKVVDERRRLGHLPLVAAIAPFVKSSCRPSSSVLCAGDETSLCFDLLVKGGTTADCVGDLVKHAAETDALEAIETDVFPELAKALDFASFEPRDSEQAKRIFRLSLVVSSTLARRDADVALRLLAGKPFRALLQNANDRLEYQPVVVVSRDAFVKDAAPILHLLAHLVFYSTHPSPLKTLLLGLDHNAADSSSSAGAEQKNSSRHHSPPPTDAKLAKHELNALLDRLRHLRPNHLPPRHTVALDRDLESIDVRWTRTTQPASANPSSL